MSEVLVNRKRQNSSRDNSVLNQHQKEANDMRRSAFKAVLWGHTIALVLITAMLFLQGFHAWGFNLPEKLVYGLAIAVVGEIPAFTFIVLKFLFQKNKE